MKRVQNEPTDGAEMRRNAEAAWKKTVPAADVPAADHETLRLLHELQVHQIELEMQNQQLLHAEEELELSRNSYVELFDFAPVSYFIFDAGGMIQEVNLAGAQLLAGERQRLIKQPFSSFIADARERETFLNHLGLVMQRKVMLRCEIRLMQRDGVACHVQLHSIPKEKIGDQSGYIATTIIDITERRRAEEKQKEAEAALQKAHDELELKIVERTTALTSTNLQLTQEIHERRRAEDSLQQAFAEIKALKDRLLAENIYLQHEIAQKHNFGEIIGQSSTLRNILSRVEQVAPMNATVLLLGETGTGKGMIARAIHSRSVRKDRPMITIDCTSLPANLIESELFGRERGAFTGADTRQIGRFELANGGTIFLDEIGDMPLELQSKMLRVIQDGEFERLGSPRTIKVDVRIIAASHRNLQEEVHNGRFREDLFYRLNVFPITLPSLRQRKDDIPLLVNHFVDKYNRKNGKQIDTVAAETLNMLLEYHWPGNVRELESVIERAIIISQGRTLQVQDRFDTVRKPEEQGGAAIKALAELEQGHILQVLQKTGWRIEGDKGAAVILGLNPSTLRARMRKYGIKRH